MKRVLLWGWAKFDCPRAVQLASSQCPFEIAAWIGDSKHARTNFTDLLYRQPEFGKHNAIIPKLTLSDNEIIGFLNRFSREKRSLGLDFHEQKHIAHNYFNYFLNLLKAENVTHVLFELVPLTGLDYICYLAAQKLGIATIGFFPSIFPNRFFYCYSIEDFGKFQSVPDFCSGSAPQVQWSFAQDLFWMRNLTLSGLYGKPWPRFLRECWRYGLRQSRKPVRMSGVVESFLKGREFSRCQVKYGIDETEVDYSKSFVYFPLHLQPELTTSALGGAFNDQLDAVERLRALLPVDWYIYLKENPKQGCEHRGLEFYHRLAGLKNVVYLRRDAGSFPLFENCQFVATITGTAGWEAVLGGKNCVVFGLAWYLNMPGVIRYSKDLTLDQILAPQPSREEKVEALEKIYTKTRPGIFDEDYCAIYPMYNSDENTRTLARSIVEVISGAITKSTGAGLKDHSVFG
jgi:hypothetical protein